MSKVKKMLLMTISLIFVASVVLTGCGKDKAADKPVEGTADKPVELVWYTIGTPQKDVDTVMNKLSEYTKEKIGVTIKMKMFDWGDYNQKMGVIATSGEPYDIAFTSSWAFDYVANAKKGAFYDLTDLMDQYGKGIEETLHPSFLEGAKIDGKLYAIPVNKELPAQRVFRYNKDLVDKYKLDIDSVKTLEDLESLLAAVKAGESGMFPFSAGRDFKFDLGFDLVNEGLPLGVRLDDNGELKLQNLFDQPEVMKHLETMHKYYKAGYLRQDAATASAGDEQKTGKWLVDMPHTQPFADVAWSESNGYPIVTRPAEEPYVYNWSVMGSMMAVSANSANPEKALQFLNLLNTDPYVRNMVNNGIEGTHYKRLSEDRIEYLPARKEAYDLPQFTLGNFFILDKLPNDPDNKWEEFKKFNDAAKNAPLLGFNFDGSNVKTEVASMQNIREEFYPSLFTGSVDPKVYVPKMLEKMKSAGLDKIEAEMQKQLDEWKQAKK